MFLTLIVTIKNEYWIAGNPGYAVKIFCKISKIWICRIYICVTELIISNLQKVNRNKMSQVI